MRADLPGVQPGGILAQRRSDAASRPDHLYGAAAGISRTGAADIAGARAARGFSAGGSEDDFVVAECMVGGGSAEGRIRRSSSAERTRRSSGMHGGECIPGEGRQNSDTAAKFGVLGGRNARSLVRDRRRRRSQRKGTSAAAGRFVPGG